MSLYRTSQGCGIDYRDEYSRRRRKYVGGAEPCGSASSELLMESG